MICRICSSHFRGFGCFVKSHSQCLQYISAEIYYTVHKVGLSDNLVSFLLPLAFETSLIISPQWCNMSSKIAEESRGLVDPNFGVCNNFFRCGHYK
jgi:hypothetical protein